MKCGASLISLGANQLYWVVQWHNNFSQMECHKDITFFRGTWSYGGMWKHHFRSPARYLGAQYSRAGMHTYAPYKVVAQPDHWILKGTNVHTGDLFGFRGIDDKPICGVETDKAHNGRTNTEVIAHGMNCASKETGILYDSNDPRWDGSGGGDLMIEYLPNGAAMLNTSAISSGAGLGADPVFSGMVQNFLGRFGPKRVV
jgi:hypothetical protein